MPKEKKPKLNLVALSALPEPIKQAGSARELCQKCGRLEKNGAPQGAFVPTVYTRKVLVVTDTPMNAEEIDELYALARKAGYGPLDIARVPAVRCRKTTPSMQQIRCCRPFVLRCIELLKPQLILAMGASALRSVTNDGKMTNVTKLRGRAIPVPNTEAVCYASYSVNSVLLGSLHYGPRIVEDLQRQAKPEVARPANQLPEVVGWVGFDTEYAPDKSLLTVGVANMKAAKAVEPGEDDFYDTLGEIAACDSGTGLVGHSVSGDVDRLVELGIARAEWVSGEATLDSLLLARLKDENRGKGGYDLEGLLCSDRNVKPWKQDTIIYSKEDATKWPVELRKERCRLDAWASVILAEGLVGDPEIIRMPVKLIHQVAMSLHRIRHAGVYIDAQKFQELETRLDMERHRAKDLLTKKAQALGMTDFQPTNDGHIRELLYERMGLPVTKTTRKNSLAAVDKVTLKQFDREEVKLLLAFNSADKAYTTNIEGLKELVQPTGRRWALYLPVNINPLGARTGRRSSERPNMQNWPVPMRQMVVSRFAWGVILENDYKSLEIFLLGYEAGDDKLIDYFANRGGYIAIAKELWKMDVKKGTNEYRATKSVVLGTNYNMQTPLMADNLWNAVGVRFSSDYDEHVRKTDELRNGYLKMFPGIPRYMDRQERFLLKHGYVVTKIGQVRHLPLSDGRNTPGYGHLLNQAINFPIQGLASAVTGSALIDCEKALVETYFKGNLVEYHARLMNHVDDNGQFTWPYMPIAVNEVHDNLVHDVPGLYAEQARAIVKERMETGETLRRILPDLPPLKVETKIGNHWGVED